MSDLGARPSVLAGRWQIPTALFALGLGIYAGARLTPKPEPIDFDQALADLYALEAGGQAGAAVDGALSLIPTVPPLSDDQRAVLHDFIADVTYRFERGRPTEPNPENLRLLLEHHDRAAELGRVPQPGSGLRAAFAHEQLGDSDAALAAYRDAVAHATTPGERRAAARGLFERLVDDEKGQAERSKLLATLLAEENVSPAYAWWGLQEAVAEALSGKNLDKARKLIAESEDGFKSSDLKGYGEYLNALLLMYEGRVDEAEPLARWVVEWAQSRTPAPRDFEGLGSLPALATALLARIHLAQAEFNEAINEFDDVLRAEPMGMAAAATHIGRAQALAALGRHDEAIASFRTALQRLPGLLPLRRIELRRDAERTLEETATQLQDGHAYEASVPYFRLRAEMSADQPAAEQLRVLENFGRACLLAAERANRDAGDDTVGKLNREAGQALEQAALRTRFDETRLADLQWSSANAYDAAGLYLDARRLLTAFLEGRSADPRHPAAMLLIGQSFEAFNELDGAQAWYARLTERFPQLEEAAQAQVRLGSCLIARGPEFFGAAEAAFNVVLNDDRRTPSSTVYRDALLELGKLLFTSERYGDAIGRLGDFLALYPEDPQRAEAQFTRADAYRRSAYQLRDHPPATAGAGDAQAESRARFGQAAADYDAMLRMLPEDSDANPVQREYRRLAMLYAADCRFELNDAESLQAALISYRSIAARYESQPTALVAQVQVANIFLRTGNQRDAARAVERARWLLRGMPDDQLPRGAEAPDRASWDRFLATVASSSLLHAERDDIR